MKKINLIRIGLALAILMILSVFIFDRYMRNLEDKVESKSKIEKVVYNTPPLNDVDSIEIVHLKKFKSGELYMKNCKFCHGNFGQGDGIKSRLNPEICPYDLSKENKSDKFIYYVILNGKDKMPNHQKLENDEIVLLIVYIKKFRVEEK